MRPRWRPITLGFQLPHGAGQKTLSNHAFGRAIDINPVQNPYIQHGVATPSGAVYDPSQPGTITEGRLSRRSRNGMALGGRWRFETDWQHFDKKL